MDLSADEEALILKRREDLALGAVGVKLDEPRADLIRQLAELNDYNRAGAYGPLPRHLDAETVALIKRVQTVGIGMRNVPHDISNPIHIPSRVAYEIIRAVRGDRVEPRAGGEQFKVPG
jgi:hypothetical protein